MPNTSVTTIPNALPGARMPPRRATAFAAAAVLAVGLAIAGLVPGCSDAEHPPLTDPATEPDTPDERGPGKRPLTPPEVEQKRAEMRAEMDRMARGYMKSFRARVYDAQRDVGIMAAQGEATVRTPEATGTFRIIYDGTKPKDVQVKVEPAEDATDLPPWVEEQVLKFAVHSLRGAYHIVVYYFPPNQWLFTRGADGAAIATAQPFKQPVTVSYRFDERELVAIRGAEAPRGTEVAQFEWREWRGRYLLDQMQFQGTGTQLSYEYDEVDGVVLLSRATLDKQDATLDATFRYWDIELGEPETPPKPEYVTVPPGGKDEE